LAQNADGGLSQSSSAPFYVKALFSLLDYFYLRLAKAGFDSCAGLSPPFQSFSHSHGFLGETLIYRGFRF
jgi:hypothetical protein